MYLVIKTPKGDWTTELVTGSLGKYGHTLRIESHIVTQGTLSHCKRVRRDILGGRRFLPKWLLKLIEIKAYKHYKSKLPKQKFCTKNQCSYYQALGYTTRPYKYNDKICSVHLKPFY